MPPLQYREWGSSKTLYCDNALLRQMGEWQQMVLHVSGYFGHQLNLHRYKVHDRDGKKVGDDPTLITGRCFICKCGVIICAEYEKGIRWFRMNRRCRGRVWVDRKVTEALTTICRERGNKPVVGIDKVASDGFVIRTLEDRLKGVNYGAKRRMIR